MLTLNPNSFPNPFYNSIYIIFFIFHSTNPEDIKIYTDRHLYLNPDSNLIISEGGTTYATFNGDDRGFSITGTITASGDISSSGELIGIIDGGSF